MTVASAQELLRRHGIDYVATKHGKFTTNCPDCNGGYLNVKVENDKVGWYCHGCDTGGSEKFERSDAPSGSDLGSIKAVYDYKDEAGKGLFQALRFEPLNQPKQFRQRTGPDQKKWSIKGVRLVPFRLPELIDAVENDRVVFVVEGEKDVLTLASHNIDATCNPMGAGKWRTEFGEAFGGADVVVCGDNDAPGRDHALKVARSLAPVARCVRVLDLKAIWPEIGESDDISDWFAAGGTVEALFEHIGQIEPFVDRPDDESPPWESGKLNGNGHDRTAAAQREIIHTLQDWLDRQLPSPDLLLGNWLSTTTRGLINAPTGLGKTMLGIGLAMRMAAGVGFLHWNSVRPATVLFIDGEMSRRRLQQRLRQEVKRCGHQPAGLHVISHEDFENFQWLNTDAGKKQIEDMIKKIGKVDFIFFDNIMSLIAGDMKEEDGWRQVLPWIKSLTKRNIGQLWLHHTGHDPSHGYGTKTREWQMDVVAHCEKVERADTDVAFLLSFPKARDRAPENRADFANVVIKLVGDAWESEAHFKPQKQKKLQPEAQKFLNLLGDAISSDDAKIDGFPATKLETWRRLCLKRGLLDDSKPDSSRATFSKYRRQLVAADRIVVDGEMVRLPAAGGYQAAMDFDR